MGLISYSLNTEQKGRGEVHERFHYDEADDKFIVEKVQDVERVLEQNREMQKADDGYTQDRSLKRVARIPLVVVEKIIKEQGWNPIDPNNSDRLMQLLDDPDYAYLKTSEGKHARKTKREFFRGSVSTKPVFQSNKIITDLNGG